MPGVKCWALDQAKLWKNAGKRLEKEIREKPPASQPLVPGAERKTWNGIGNRIWKRIGNGIWNGIWNGSWDFFPVPVECQELKVGIGSGKTLENPREKIGKRLEKEFREKPPASQPLVPEAERKTWNGSGNRIRKRIGNGIENGSWNGIRNGSWNRIWKGIGNGIWNGIGNGSWSFPSPCGMPGVKVKVWIRQNSGKLLEKDWKRKSRRSHQHPSLWCPRLSGKPGMGSGVGSGKGSGMGAGIGSGKGLGIGSGMGAGMGAGIGSGKGSGMGSGMGAGMGAGIGSGKGLRMGSGMGLGMGAGVFPVPVGCQGLKVKFGSGKTLENSWKKTGKGDPGEATSIPAFGARG
ncbi:hypothetical protein DUI87_33348 [Hirundo rustica rustica]|uniref:Uncharacterized protein n=1 Tax=Hirundo rustica rustica TaxID=333673 RepID=A0A3M0IP60_HIRRU|nr:hypothetical protein DUI87_33348 [Hirundo rustica rustica]